MEEGEFSVLFHSYRELREAVAVNGFYSLVAGLIIATFIFKLLDMANDMIKEEKGFNAKHFFELGREYIFCTATCNLRLVLSYQFPDTPYLFFIFSIRSGRFSPVRYTLIDC